MRWKAGEQEAFDRLLPLVYAELRNIARKQLRRERPDHTLQSAALVNEAYLRLSGQRPFDAENRLHFLAVASRLMRQILVDHARNRAAAKRGADQRAELDTQNILPQAVPADLIALDDALQALAKLDQLQARIVELKFFGGLTNEEIAKIEGISLSTVKREWNVARAWLTRQMRKEPRGTGMLGKS